MNRPGLARPLVALSLALLLAAPAGAQRSEPTESEEESQRLFFELRTRDLADLDLEALGAESYDEDVWAQAALDALASRQNVRARELTEAILSQDPGSIPGLCLLAMVFHRAEANLPRALFHFRQCRERFEALHGPFPTDDSPWPWHAQAILGQAMVSGEMGRHEDKVRHLLEHDELYSPPTPAERGWPLMRLRRYEEARAAVEEALQLDDPEQVAHALTSRCAIEAELQDRRLGYEACLEAAEFERVQGRPGPTPFTNAAEGTLGVLRFDEAEELILEGSRHFGYGAVANPWLDLTHLYLLEGRTSEALDAVREMFDWRRRQPPFVDEQNRAETELTSAIFLLVAGYPQETAGITRRAMARPDRTGFTSSESEQMEAASAIVDALAHRTVAEHLDEAASWSSPWDATKALTESLRHRLRAWTSARRAASLVSSSERILLATLRPYLAGSLELPEWIEPELVAALGPGVAAAAVERARRAEAQDVIAQEAEGYFDAFDAEIAWHSGSYRRCLEATDRALVHLPGAEVLLRARVAARGAQAAEKRGEREHALELFDQVLQSDPGVIRRLGAALPTTFEGQGGAVARKALDHLEDSPRLRKVRGGGAFRVTVRGDDTSGEACLLGPRGTRYACARVQPRAGENATDTARRLAEEFHLESFAPRLDLTQSDLRSLDGSPTAAGGRGRERLRSVLEDVAGAGG